LRPVTLGLLEAHMPAQSATILLCGLDSNLAAELSIYLPRPSALKGGPLRKEKYHDEE
jgi:hypothetical protein